MVDLDVQQKIVHHYNDHLPCKGSLVRFDLLSYEEINALSVDVFGISRKLC